MSAELAQAPSRPRRESILPRFIRAGAAPIYLGMCRAEFDKTVRPYVSEFPIGERGVGFDRQELDDWATAYVEAKAIDKNAPRSNNCPAASARKEINHGAKIDQTCSLPCFSRSIKTNLPSKLPSWS
jgi:predicted DNA-binding transcriptional regulator AlpA